MMILSHNYIKFSLISVKLTELQQFFMLDNINWFLSWIALTLSVFDVQSKYYFQRFPFKFDKIID